MLPTILCTNCSVGGLDYGTVRTAAFMGLRLLSEAADTLQRRGSHCLPAHKQLVRPADNGACKTSPLPPPPHPIGEQQFNYDLCRTLKQASPCFFMRG